MERVQRSILKERVIKEVSSDLDLIANFVGQTVLVKISDHLRHKVEAFDIQITNPDNLETVRTEPFILVANHIKTDGPVINGRGISVTPDAFVLQKAVEDQLERRPKIVASSDFGFNWHTNSAIQKMQQRVEKWRAYALEGANYIPIRRGDSRVNLNFIRQIQKTLHANDPVIIFPEGNSYTYNRPQPPIKDGVAWLAKRNGVKIVPAHIEGATSWQKGTKVSVDFRTPIVTDHLEPKEITALVKTQIEK